MMTTLLCQGIMHRVAVVLCLSLLGGSACFSAEVVEGPKEWQDWPLCPAGEKPRAANRIAPASVPKVPAFPDAQGHGALSIGGRGGRVIKVTTLAAKGPGSLDEALKAKGPRIVVFDVSGVIRNSWLTVEDPRITIAGQTAPGAGIAIEGRLCTPYEKSREHLRGHPDRYPLLHDITIRFLRIRCSIPRKAKWGDQWDAVQLIYGDRVVGDHVSMAWAIDETCESSGTTNITWQWCAAEESSLTGHSEGQHNYGMKGAGAPYGFIHHNLMAHHSRRNPSGTAHVYNNVVYDFRDGFVQDCHPPKEFHLSSSSNIIGNYYKQGPSSKKAFPFCFKPNMAYYLTDNFIHGVGVVNDPWAEADKHPGLKYYAKKGMKLTRPRPYPHFPVAIHSPRDAYDLVLAHAGCLPRDRVSRRTVEEVEKGTGKWGRNAPDKPTDQWYLEGLQPGKPKPDSDNDGMPDEWEKAKGLDPKDPKDANGTVPKGVSPGDRHAGYTYIEYYVNDLADQLVVQALRDWLKNHPGSKAVKKELERMRRFLP